MDDAILSELGLSQVIQTHDLSLEESNGLKEMVLRLDLPRLQPWTTKYETPSFLCQRFLRARNFDVDKALEMLTEDLQWREDYGILHLRQQQPADFCKGFDPNELFARLPILLEGIDNLHRPVIYKMFGAACEISTLLKTTDEATLIRYHIWQNEQSLMELRRLSEKYQHNIETWQIVIDAAGWHLGLANSASMSFLKAIASIDSAHYPERLGRLTVVNAPWTLSGVWRVIRLWLDERQKKKIAIMSWQSAWEPYLLGGVGGVGGEVVLLESTVPQFRPKSQLRSSMFELR